MTSKHPPSHLPHLDGLRLLALLGVLLFHFEVAPFSGGFIGVDVFLALSGFLITRNLLHSLVASSFSLRAFYLRRFWRLYPAALATVLLALLLAFLSFPSDLSLSTARSGAAALLLLANASFYRESGYFDDDATLKPLLHVWSLSLEEQFYLFWPLLLAFAYARPTPALPVAVVLLGAASFSLAAFLHSEHPSFVFFLLPARTFEFAIGGLLALSEPLWTPSELPSTSRKIIGNVLALSSLAVISTAYVVMPDYNPPLYAVPVLLATVALIATPRSFVCVYLLSNRPATFLGNLTYSAYLTHWVIFVFARYFSSGLRVPMPSAQVLTGLTFASAWVLRNAVENPLRKGRAKFLAALCLGLFATGGLCVAGLLTDGWSFRFSAEDKMDVRRSVVLSFRDMCVDPDYVKRNDFLNNYSDGCKVGEIRQEASKVVVMGDSYARHLIPAFNKIGKEHGVSFMFNFKTNCPLMGKGDKMIGTKDDFCRGFQRRRWRLLDGEEVEDAEKLPRNATVVVASFGEYASLEARRRRLGMLATDLQKAGHRLLAAGEPPGMLQDEKWRFACLDLERSALVRVGKVVLGGGKRSSCMSEWMKPNGRSLEDWEGYVKVFEEDEGELRGAGFLDLYGPVCKKDEEGEEICRLLGDFEGTGGKGLDLGYGRDGHHLTIQGSEFLARVIEKRLPWGNARGGDGGDGDEGE